MVKRVLLRFLEWATGSYWCNSWESIARGFRYLFHKGWNEAYMVLRYRTRSRTILDKANYVCRYHENVVQDQYERKQNQILESFIYGRKR